MSEIPDDLREKAEIVWLNLSNQRSDGVVVDPVTAIAQALAAERERCAKIAEKERAYYEGINDGEWGSGAEVVSEKIRDAIRSPS